MRKILILAAAGMFLAVAGVTAGGVQVVSLPEGAHVPDAAVDETGTIHVAYVLGDDLYYSRSADDGKTFSDPLRVNSDSGSVYGGMYRGPDLSVGAGGRVHVIWYNNAYQQKKPKEEWGVMYAWLEPGAAAFQGERNLNHLPSDNFSLAAAENNRVAVIWTAGGMFLQLSTDGGMNFSKPMQVDPSNVDPCECCGTRAMYAPDGRLYVLYRDKRNNIRNMHLLSGTPEPDKPGDFVRVAVSGEDWQINGCPMTGSFLELFGRRNILAAWETKATINTAEVSPDGKILAPGRVRAGERGKYPLALAGREGEVLTAWKRGKTLEWKLYRGLADSAPRADSTESATVDRPAGAVTSAGNFLLFP